MRTNSKAIILIIMNIVKKWCVYVFYHNCPEKDIILRLTEELAASIGQKFPNNHEICYLYFEIIQMIRLVYRNDISSKSILPIISFKSELHDVQQRFFHIFNSIIPKNIFGQMMYLTSKSYWQHSTSFYFAPCVQLVSSYFREDPRIKYIPYGSIQRENYVHSSEYSNSTDVAQICSQEAQKVLKIFESFEMDLSMANYSCFYNAVWKLIERDDHLSKHLWNKLLFKVFSVLDDHSQRVIAFLIEDFVRKELTKSKGKKHTENILSFADIYLRNSKPSFVNHSFLKFGRDFPNLRERSCLYLEDCVLQKHSGLELNHKTYLQLLSKTYSFLHEDDLLSGLLHVKNISYPRTTKTPSNRYMLLKNNFYRIATESIVSKQSKRTATLFPQKAGVHTRNPIGIKCLKEINNWSNLRRSDKTIVYNSDIHSEIKKTLHYMKTLFLNEKASLVTVSDSIKNLIHNCTEEWSNLHPLVLAEKHYSMMKIRRKVSNLEEAYLFQKSLFNLSLDNQLSNLRNILESWCFHTLVDDDLSFWKDIFKVRLSMLKYIPFHLSANCSEDKTKVIEVKSMAHLSYTVSQIHRTNLFLSHGFLKKGFKILNCLLLNSTMNEHIMQLCMRSVFLQMKQYDNTIEINYLLEKASDFIDLNLYYPTNPALSIMYSIYETICYSLQDSRVAREALKPCYNSIDWSIGWIYCGEYFQKIFSCNDEKQYLEFAMECFVKACKYKNEADSGSLIAKILWIFSYEDDSSSLSKTFIKNGGEDVLVSCWLPWIPQLLTAILRSPSCNLSFLLYSVAFEYPNSLYLLLKSFLEKIASEPNKRRHEKCFKQILDYLETNYPKLCYTLKNTTHEFLVLARNIPPDFYNMLKKIESGICDVLFQSATKQIDTDIVSKISDLFLQGFSNLEERNPCVSIILKELFDLRKSGDLKCFLQNFYCWKAYYLETEKTKKRLFPLKMKSTFLSTFHLHQEKIDMFTNSYFKPNCVQISKFLPVMEIMEGYDESTYRIAIEGDNGKVYSYLIILNMCEENIFQEDRVFQLFTFLNSLMTTETLFMNHSLQLKIPTFVCIHPHLKMVQSVSTSYSLLDIYNQHCATFGLQNVISIYLQYLSNICLRKEFKQTLGLSCRNEAFRLAQKHLVPKTILKKKFENQSAINYMESRKLFSKDIALIGISRFLFLLNKQMPEKIFINQHSGEILFFGLKFNMVNVHDSQDTCIPFRLTENISEFITPFGISGYVKSAIHKFIRCFYKHEDRIESFLKTLLLDEFDDIDMNICKQNHHKRIFNIVQSITQKIEDYVDENHGEDLIQFLLLTSRGLDNLSSASPSWYPWL